MKRASSAPCLADDDNEAKKIRDESGEPTSREYLQLALARVLELQRQVKDETYTTDNTSDLGESDSEEEDVMKEVLVKVFRDLPGSSATITSIINGATRPQPPQVRAIKDKRIQLAGYDTCRRVALDFMNTVVKSTPMTDSEADYNFEKFERGTFSKIEPKLATLKTGLTVSNAEPKTGSSEEEKQKLRVSDTNYTFQAANESRRIFRNINQEQLGIYEHLNSIAHPLEHPTMKQSKNVNSNSANIEVSNENGPKASRDYEVRVRMLRGLDLHLATKQRDFTARLMRQ